ncbi:hypothetical protein evm_012701 [Chilo suppressalis]|nr:hypothetical protein evm_012701 [Chilo suppressalis]
MNTSLFNTTNTKFPVQCATRDSPPRSCTMTKQTHWESKPRGRRDFMTWPRQWGLVQGEGGTLYMSTCNSQTFDPQEGKGGIVCELCGKTYPNNVLLKLHLHRHSGVKPFACSVCDKRFSNSTSLTVHSRVHTGEKPYSCK